MQQYDVIIIGAGAAGLFCAIHAGRRGRRVLVLDVANKAGKKILMSGGGRCNFTNLHTTHENFISNNPHFCKSALSRYTQWDFVELVKKHGILFHEKTLGQLFCNNKAKEILAMLLKECEAVKARIQLEEEVTSIVKTAEDQFKLTANEKQYSCESLVVATGGLSIPTLGSSPFGYKIAEQFGLKVYPTRAGLVPFTLHDSEKNKYAKLSGISVDCIASNERQSFRENMLFTHRGLSGPAILQISSYWQPGEVINIRMNPDVDLHSILMRVKEAGSRKTLRTILYDYFPKRLVECSIHYHTLEMRLPDMPDDEIKTVSDVFQAFSIKPNGTEGYRTAEVTLGGVDTDELSSKTMEVQSVPGLYFIGEVVDVTGWLGGYNFQWAWSSGWAAGQCV